MFHILDLMEREARTHGDVTIRTGVLRDWTNQLREEFLRLETENAALKAQADSAKVRRG